jgi:hypothetical protein
VAVHFGFDLKQRVRAMRRGDSHKLPAVRVTAIYFVQTTRRIASPADNGSTGKNVVHERSGLGTVKQTGPRLSFHSNSHDSIFFIDAGRDQTRDGSVIEDSFCVESESLRNKRNTVRNLRTVLKILAIPGFQ